ncbi:MAG TPA: hypothetical protein DD417_07330 [Elusimicrobia bacterium]|nr:hypothetical protein [Elusimicrobiota bacterium]
MDPNVADAIADDVARALRRAGYPVLVGISNRHFHVTEKDWRVLFGDQDPKPLRPVRQPRQWAGAETVAIEGPKGRFPKVRLLGPFRKVTQVEVSRSDAMVLGLEPPVRGSGSLKGAAPIRLAGPKGSVEVREGLIISQRHLHLGLKDSEDLCVRDGDVVRVRAGTGGPRELVFEGVLARVAKDFALEFHVDTDEANAAWLNNGDRVIVL